MKVKGVLVDEKRHIRFADWNANDVSTMGSFEYITNIPIHQFPNQQPQIEVLNKYLFLTSKPVIYLVNLSEADYIRQKNGWLSKIKEWVDVNDAGAVFGSIRIASARNDRRRGRMRQPQCD